MELHMDFESDLIKFLTINQLAINFASLPWILLAFLGVFVIANTLWIRSLYAAWQKDFGPRVSRFHQHSHSRKMPPHAQCPFQRGSVRERVEHTVAHANEIFARHERVKQRFPQTITPMPKNNESPRRAVHLDMDHQRVDFFDYLWAFYFIVPNAVFLWITGILRLKIREALRRVFCRRLGVRNPAECVDSGKIIGRLLLEGTQLVHFVCKVQKNNKEVATFVWTDFPMLDGNGKFRIAKILSIDIDLEKKCFEQGSLDGEPLAVNDALILVWFHTIFANHVKIHSYANWAANAQDHSYDAFQHRMSVTTIMYNYFGSTLFPRITSAWQKLGFSDTDFHSIIEVIEKGVSNGVPNHAGIRELVPHSEVARFMILVRSHFHHTFEEHKAEFPGIDAESLFVGTIMHSLDHTLMGWNLEDPLYLDMEGCDPRFRVMAELGRFVRAGFVDDLPFLMFNKNYSNAPGKFYKRVYRYAAKVNKKLADHMDCCIIK